jgi:hypothetical protein
MNRRKISALQPSVFGFWEGGKTNVNDVLVKIFLAVHTNTLLYPAGALRLLSHKSDPMLDFGSLSIHVSCKTIKECQVYRIRSMLRV